MVYNSLVSDISRLLLLALRILVTNATAPASINNDCFILIHKKVYYGVN
jgi:hypothetical protein